MLIKLTLLCLAVFSVFPPVPLCAQGREAFPRYKDLIEYLDSGNAVPACGVCLESAKKYTEDMRKEALARKTRGMAPVPAGDYPIGAEKGKGDPDELPKHTVFLDAFYLDKYETTIAEYQEFVKATGDNHPEWSKPGGKFNLETGKEKYYRRLEGLIQSCLSCPAFGVFWADADAYCRWKNKRLPTEAEWETAAAAGSAAKYGFGDSEAGAGDFAWHETNSGEIPHKVGSKKPNALGLYDMHGNVWEWVQDFYDKAYYATSPRRNPKGPESGKEHVIRGGSWASGADELGVTNRVAYGKANDDIGFRCAVSKDEVELRK